MHALTSYSLRQVQGVFTVHVSEIGSNQVRHTLETFARKWSRDLWRIARDLFVTGKARCALRNVHGADLAGPVIDVAELPLMDLLKVRQVELASNGRYRKFIRPHGSKGRFNPIQFGLGADAKSVA